MCYLNGSPNPLSLGYMTGFVCSLDTIKKQELTDHNRNSCQPSLGEMCIHFLLRFSCCLLCHSSRVPRNWSIGCTWWLKAPLLTIPFPGVCSAARPLPEPLFHACPLSRSSLPNPRTPHSHL